MTAGPAAQDGPPPLEALTALFDALDVAGIRYCHWKSNEHLDASLRGATDLDVLFDRRQVLHVAHLLTRLGCKRFVVKPGRGYPGIEDFVVFDAPTGALAHLHAHYQLTVGEKFLKGYRLPWEEYVLATRTRDVGSGVWVADPTWSWCCWWCAPPSSCAPATGWSRSPAAAGPAATWSASCGGSSSAPTPRLADVARPVVGARLGRAAGAGRGIAAHDAPAPAFRDAVRPPRELSHVRRRRRAPAALVGRDRDRGGPSWTR
jgi:hypothetical protein